MPPLASDTPTMETWQKGRAVWMPSLLLHTGHEIFPPRLRPCLCAKEPRPLQCGVRLLALYASPVCSNDLISVAELWRLSCLWPLGNVGQRACQNFRRFLSAPHGSGEPCAGPNVCQSVSDGWDGFGQNADNVTCGTVGWPECCISHEHDACFVKVQHYGSMGCTRRSSIPLAEAGAKRIATSSS